MIGIRKIGSPGNEGGINSFQSIDRPPKRKVKDLSKSNPVRPLKGGDDIVEISPEARKLSKEKNSKKDN